MWVDWTPSLHPYPLAARPAPHPGSLMCFCWTRVGPGGALHRPGLGGGQN